MKAYRVKEVVVTSKRTFTVTLIKQGWFSSKEVVAVGRVHRSTQGPVVDRVQLVDDCSFVDTAVESAITTALLMLEDKNPITA